MNRRLIYIIAAVVIAAAAAAVFLIFKSSGAANIPAVEASDEAVMLVDYCRKTTATVGGDGYTEIVLYMDPDNGPEIHYYSKYEGDAKEQHSAFLADDAALEEVYGLIGRYDFDKWNEGENAPGPDGVQYILKYLSEEGEYIRVSSDHMPEGGEDMMSEVGGCLTDHTGGSISAK